MTKRKHSIMGFHLPVPRLRWQGALVLAIVLSIPMALLGVVVQLGQLLW